MGYYDEAIEAYRMALDIAPNDDYAKKNLQNTLENKRRREDKANGNNVEDSSKSGTFWDALGNFCSVLGNMMGATSNYTYENSFSNGSSYSTSGSGTTSGNASSV